MKRLRTIFFVLGVLGLITGLIAQTTFADTLVSGVWRKGSNVTEPKPQKSAHLKTVSGGFGSTDEGVKYVLNVAITKPFKDDMSIRAEFQNPLDLSAPFIEEGTIEAKAKSIRLVHGPVKGLKIHRSYWVKISIYAPDDKATPVDTLTQNIKSYFDTTTDEVLMKTGLEEGGE
jgi:hypothetical protein